MPRVMSFPKQRDADIGERVGEHLLRLGLITEDQLFVALHEQKHSAKMLGAILVELGFLDHDGLAKVLAERVGFPTIDLATTLLDAELFKDFPKEAAERCRAIPVRLEGGVYNIAVADPYDITALDEIARYIPAGVRIAPLVASEAAIAEGIENYDDPSDEFDHAVACLHEGRSTGNGVHPVVRLVDLVMADGVRRNASDIHWEPEGTHVRLRYRIDGLMRQVRIFRRAHWPEISHRLKIMAGMNIADTRSMQDGRFELVLGGATIDFRVAVMPTVQGENIVIRILDHRRALLSLDKLGFSAEALRDLDELLQKPQGVLFVTGPTGSGKTTSLYAMLSRIRSPDVNIMTLEEPVEYRFDMIRQTSVSEGRGFGFADGVRGLLRQAPDIIFIGEVRDPDTAQMAMRASMTGHQVFTTLHCNDALGALIRLYDLGLSPRLMSGNVNGVVAQRLVRKLCMRCRIERPATEAEAQFLCNKPTTPKPAAHLGFAEAQGIFETPQDAKPVVFDATGCGSCNGSGRKGRTVVAEIMRISPKLDDMIAADAPRSELVRQLREEGFRSMVDDGREKLRAGEVAFDDLCRAVDITRGE